MLVKILNKGHWPFSDGRITVYDEGILCDVERSEAERMIESGFAVREPTENQGRKPEPDSEAKREERFRLYEKRFSLAELKEFCKANGIPVKSKHRTIPAIIGVILKREEENGEFNFDEGE